VPIHTLQKQFIDELKRVLSQHHGHGRALTEGAAVTCVKLCKSSTYVNITDRANVLFVLVHTVNQDLKVSMERSYRQLPDEYEPKSGRSIIVTIINLSAR